MGFMIFYPRYAEIYGEEEQAEYFYKVISGGVRTSKILEEQPKPDHRLLCTR